MKYQYVGVVPSFGDTPKTLIFPLLPEVALNVTCTS